MMLASSVFLQRVRASPGCPTRHRGELCPWGLAQRAAPATAAGWRRRGKEGAGSPGDGGPGAGPGDAAQPAPCPELLTEQQPQAAGAGSGPLRRLASSLVTLLLTQLPIWHFGYRSNSMLPFSDQISSVSQQPALV